MSEWQDISTAPKDGSMFLAWEETTGRVCASEWEDADEMEIGLGATVGFVVFDFYTQREVFDHKMTHWMPLPAKPTTGE